MNEREYTEWTRTTALYPFNKHIIYPALGVINEIGEFAGKVKKQMRGDSLDLRDAMQAELGDVLWYAVRLLDDVGSDFSKHTVVMYADELKPLMASDEFPLILSLSLARFSGEIAQLLCEYECDPACIDRAVLEDLALGVYAILCVGAESFGSSIEQLMAQNMAKLEERKNRGTLRGNGDNR